MTRPHMPRELEKFPCAIRGATRFARADLCEGTSFGQSRKLLSSLVAFIPGEKSMSGQVVLYFDDQSDALRFALAAGSVMAGEGGKFTSELVEETTRVTRIRLDAVSGGNLKKPGRRSSRLNCFTRFRPFVNASMRIGQRGKHQKDLLDLRDLKNFQHPFVNAGEGNAASRLCARCTRADQRSQTRRVQIGNAGEIQNHRRRAFASHGIREIRVTFSIVSGPRKLSTPRSRRSTSNGSDAIEQRF